MKLKNEMVEEKILKQVDKNFILAIDPETKLPFTINMGTKSADIIDLDNRPLNMKNNASKDISRLDSSFDNLSLASVKEQLNDGSNDNYHPILDPKNYPFYQKVKRNLYIMEQLLIDDNNAATLKNIESAPIENNEIDRAKDKRSKSAGKSETKHL